MTLLIIHLVIWNDGLFSKSFDFEIYKIIILNNVFLYIYVTEIFLIIFILVLSDQKYISFYERVLIILNDK